MSVTLQISLVGLCSVFGIMVWLVRARRRNQKSSKQINADSAIQTPILLELDSARNKAVPAPQEPARLTTDSLVKKEEDEIKAAQERANRGEIINKYLDRYKKYNHASGADLTRAIDLAKKGASAEISYAVFQVSVARVKRFPTIDLARNDYTGPLEVAMLCPTLILPTEIDWLVNRYASDGASEKALQAATIGGRALKPVETRILVNFHTHKGELQKAKEAAKIGGRVLMTEELNEMIGTCIYLGKVSETQEAAKIGSRVLTAKEVDRMIARCIELGKVSETQEAAKIRGQELSPHEVCSLVSACLKNGDLTSAERLVNMQKTSDAQIQLAQAEIIGHKIKERSDTKNSGYGDFSLDMLKVHLSEAERLGLKYHPTVIDGLDIAATRRIYDERRCDRFQSGGAAEVAIQGRVSAQTANMIVNLLIRNGQILLAVSLLEHGADYKGVDRVSSYYLSQNDLTNAIKTGKLGVSAFMRNFIISSCVDAHCSDLAEMAYTSVVISPLGAHYV